MADWSHGLGEAAWIPVKEAADGIKMVSGDQLGNCCDACGTGRHPAVGRAGGWNESKDPQEYGLSTWKTQLVL